MAFNTYEISAELGQPVELYEFLLAMTYYRYTSDAAEITVDSHLFLPIPISRSRLASSKEEKSGDRLEITIPASDPLAQCYVNVIPGKRAALTLYRVHRNDPALESIVVFRGGVQMIRFDKDETIATLQVMPITNALTRPIPRQTYQNLCNHMLYDSHCQIDENDLLWEHTLTVTAVSGNTITVPGAGALGADFFEAGFITFDSDYRLIVGQAGDVLTLFTPFTLSPLSQVVVLHAGCKHRLDDDCQTKFNNIVHFGGFPFVPLNNPFTDGL